MINEDKEFWEEQLGMTLESKQKKSGGSAYVWKATVDGMPRAVKISKKAVENSSAVKEEKKGLREIQGLDHPQIVRLLGFRTVPVTDAQGATENHLVTFWEWAEGTLSQERNLPQEKLLGFMRDVASALDHLHLDRHIYHLDVKPDNIMLFQGRNNAKLGDLGLARIVGLTTMYDPQKEEPTGSIFGTPGFIPPEILQQLGPSSRSDLYSLVISYVKMRTGRFVFEPSLYDPANAAAFDQLLQQVSDETFIAQRLRDLGLPAEEVETVLAGLRFDPYQRFQGTHQEWVMRLQSPLPETEVYIDLPNREHQQGLPAIEERNLRELMYQFVRPQLSKLLRNIEMPLEYHPNHPTQGEQVDSLIAWASSPGGCGLKRLSEEIEKLTQLR